MAGEAMTVKSGTQQTGAAACKRGMRLPRAWTGGGRAVPDADFLHRHDLFVSPIVAIQGHADYSFVTMM